MNKFCRKVKAFFKSGINKVIEFCRVNKNTIIRLVGKLVIYTCKTIIEIMFDDIK